MEPGQNAWYSQLVILKSKQWQEDQERRPGFRVPLNRLSVFYFNPGISLDSSKPELGRTQRESSRRLLAQLREQARGFPHAQKEQGSSWCFVCFCFFSSFFFSPVPQQSCNSERPRDLNSEEERTFSPSAGTEVSRKGKLKPLLFPSFFLSFHSPPICAKCGTVMASARQNRVKPQVSGLKTVRRKPNELKSTREIAKRGILEHKSIKVLYEILGLPLKVDPILNTTKDFEN